MFLALVTGLGLGVFVAAQVGPIWLLCARSSLRYGARTGLAIGAGAAVVDFCYASLGVAGAASLVQIHPLRLTLGVVGGAVLVLLGARTLRHAMRIRHGGETEGEVLRPGSAFRTSLAATASNPATIASWAAVFSAASVGHLAATTTNAVAMLVGIGLGSLLWFAVLSAVAGHFGRRLGPSQLAGVDAFAGAGIAGFGGLLVWRALRT